jgi:hypothetical protein
MVEARQREEWFRLTHAIRAAFEKGSLDELNPFVRRQGREKRSSSTPGPRFSLKEAVGVFGAILGNGNG